MSHPELSTFIARITRSLTPEEIAAVDRHLADCEACRDESREADVLVELIRSSQLWDQISSMNALANEKTVIDLLDRVHTERNATETILGKIEASAARNQQLVPSEWCTVGTALRVLDRVRELGEVDSSRAIDLSEILLRIVRALPRSERIQQMAISIEASTLLTKASLLVDLGRVEEAFDALDLSSSLLRESPAGEYELARTNALRGEIHLDEGLNIEALALLHDAAATFERYGDADLTALTRAKEATALMRIGCSRAAADLIADILPALERSGSVADHVRACMDAAEALTALGDIGAARDYVERARVPSAASPLNARLQWLDARVSLSEGDTARAIEELTSVHESFLSDERMLDAGLVALDKSEALLRAGQTRQAEEAILAAAGLISSALPDESVQTTLAFLIDRQRDGTLTPGNIRRVRDGLNETSLRNGA